MTYSSPDFALMAIPPFKTQLLKWVGNKQRMAHLIASEFPPLKGKATYYEPFLGSGAVLGTLQPPRAVGSDGFGPLIGIWECLRSDPALLVEWYRERFEKYSDAGDRVAAYEEIKASYNNGPNAADLLFLARSCYGGVVRFRKADGHMSTPCGIHQPIRPESFKERVRIWHERTRGAVFRHLDFREAFALANAGDVIYCDPPYVDTQAILYGSQSFRLNELLHQIAVAKDRGVFVALSIDGSKKSGKHNVLLDIPEGLFEAELAVTVGRSMLRRFQKEGQSLEDEVVKDRLLLTYDPINAVRTAMRPRILTCADTIDTYDVIAAVEDWLGPVEEMVNDGERVKRVREIHQPHRCRMSTRHIDCSIMFGGECNYVDKCNVCHTEYPCPTIRTLDGPDD